MGEIQRTEDSKQEAWRERWKDRAMVDAMVKWLSYDLEIEMLDEELAPSEYRTMHESEALWDKAVEPGAFWVDLRDDPTGLWKRIVHPKWPDSTPIYLSYERLCHAEDGSCGCSVWEIAESFAESLHGKEKAKELSRYELSVIYETALETLRSILARLGAQG